MRRAVAVLLFFAGCGAGCGDGPDIGPRTRTLAGLNGDPGNFADGDAEDARFNQPEGLALDSTGSYLYIVDQDNHAVRRLELATNKVTTIAGIGGEHGADDSSASGAGRFRFPRQIVITPDDKTLYVTDSGNFTIRKIDLVTGALTTPFGVAGEAGSTDGVGTAARFGQGGLGAQWPGGLALDAAGTTMYVVDSANEILRVIDLGTGAVTTLAGKLGVDGYADDVGPAAIFDKPMNIVPDGAGHLYLTEANNIDIRKIDLSTLAVTTVAGKAPPAADQYCELVARVLPAECGADDAANGLDARFRFPFGTTPDGAGGFFFADSHNDLIRRFDMTTTAVTTVAGVQQTILDDITHASQDSSASQAGTFWHPTHVAFRAPNILYVSDRSANCIRRVELPTAAAP